MEDSAIIELYFARCEQAIAETDVKYGPLCRSLAANILGTPEDAEECVWSGYQRTWDSIPPQRPLSLRAFVARIVRNLSISRLRALRAGKRSGSGADVLLSELEDCLPSGQGDPCSELERRELTRCIDRWLDSLSAADRYLFVQRYWYGRPAGELSGAAGVRSAAQRLYRLRLRLRAYLEKEGFDT